MLQTHQTVEVLLDDLRRCDHIGWLRTGCDWCPESAKIYYRLPSRTLAQTIAARHVKLSASNRRTLPGVEHQDYYSKWSTESKLGTNALRRIMISYCYSPELTRFSDLLPSNPKRSSLTHGLIQAYGLLNHATVDVVDPEPATRRELLSYHTAEYLDALWEAESGEIADDDLSRFGLEHDCPVFPGLKSYVCYVAGASLAAARTLTRGVSPAEVAISFDGGRHHAKRFAASGFCYVQDIVLAIQELRKLHSRVLYIDLDLHHGDGVEAAFVHSDRVFTLSLHRYDQGFFPNSGGFHDQGKGRGKGFSMNIPLKRGLSDQSLKLLVEQVIIPVIESYIDKGSEQSIVVQCGVDSLALDPYKEWNISIDGYCAAIAQIHEKAKALGAKLLLLGGGGYNITAASRCYSAILATLLDVELGDIPEHVYWPDYAESHHELARFDTNAGMVDENIDSLPALISCARQRIASKSGSTIPTSTNKKPQAMVDWSIRPTIRAVAGPGNISSSANGKISNALVMLHGLGDRPESIFKLGSSFNLPETVVVSLRGPFSVPLIADDDNQAYMWGEQLEFSESGGLVDEADFTHAKSLISAVLDEIVAENILPGQITVFGHGQGGMLALEIAASRGTNVVSIGATLPTKSSDLPSTGRRALICGGDVDSNVEASALKTLNKHFTNVAHLKWRQSGDAFPSTSKRNCWRPILEFLSKCIVQMRGLPEGTVQLE